MGEQKFLAQPFELCTQKTILHLPFRLYKDNKCKGEFRTT